MSEHDDGDGKQGDCIYYRGGEKMLSKRWFCICPTVVYVLFKKIVVYADRIKNWLKEPVYLLLLFF